MVVDKCVVASINMNGVKGKIEFRQATPSAPVVITTSLQGAGLSTRGLLWHVHDYPMSYSFHPVDQCSAKSVGGHYDPYTKASLPQYETRCASNAADCEVGDLSGRHGELTARARYEDRFLSLSGRHSIAGRSIVVHRPDGTRWVCANILPCGEVGMRTAIARLNGPVVGGTVTFRQPADDAKADTSVLVDLYRTDGGAFDTFQHTWHVHTTPVDLSNDTLETNVSLRCKSAGGHYDPLQALRNPDYARDCNAQNPNKCEVGDLAAKHGRITLPTSGSYKAFATDVFLPLSGPYNIIGRSVVVHAASGMGNRIACADIHELLPREMSATFDMRGVKGVMTFSQLSPWDPTKVSTGLTGLAGLAGGYHVHEFPRSIHGSTQYPSACSGAEVGGHWNPFNAPFPAQVPLGFERSHDLYEVGDLSGKHGSFAGLHTVDQEHSDCYLPLFGPHSIVGRSIVIHRNEPNAPRWVCADIAMPPTSRQSATARLMSPFAGTIYFRQIDQFETSVFVDLARTDGRLSSRNHNWHVHTNAVFGDQFSTTARCASAGGHYNPFNVVTTSMYNCSDKSQHRCEEGDSSGKSSPLHFNTAGPSKFLYTDSFLPLTGPYSVIGRSVVIHAADKGGARLACGNIVPFASRRAQASFGNAGVSGFISFHQSDPLSSTVVSVQLSGIGGRASEYALHYLPTVDTVANGPTVSPAVMDPCTADIIGTVYNPTAVPPSMEIIESPRTSDMLGTGRLSDKFGSLTRLSGMVSSYADEHYLPMTGPLNFVGRSVSLHQASDNSPWVCSTVQYLGGRIVTALAKFTGTLSGEIHFRQIDNLPTQITIRLHHGLLPTATANHRWAVHSLPVGSDSMSPVNRCLSAGTVYNPANVSSSDTGYIDRCSSISATCRLGDVWYKHGLLRIAGAQQRPNTVLLTEDFLPLSGPLSGEWFAQ